MNEMERVEPRWVEESKNSALKANFEKTVQVFKSGFCVTIVGQWIDAVDRGE